MNGAKKEVDLSRERRSPDPTQPDPNFSRFFHSTIVPFRSVLLNERLKKALLIEICLTT